MELPHLQKLADEYRSVGLEVVTLNRGDTDLAIQSYFQSERLTLKTGMLRYAGDVADRYGIQAYPTNYLIDRDGRVAWRGVGFDEKALRAAISALGMSPRTGSTGE